MGSKQIVVAIDAMGGDDSPAQNILGTILAAKISKDNVSFILVGDEEAIKNEINGELPKNVEIKHASDKIEMKDHPVRAIKKKIDSSLVVAAKMVKEGQADALVTAGNTGAATAAGLLIIGRIKGIVRPAIAAMFPTDKGFSFILDVGANADCKPDNLVEFAKMGDIYVRQIKGIERPTIGLLSIGEERSKGNLLTTKTYELLENTGLNFHGNIEGRDLPTGVVDIIICDGFTGNIALKLMEGVAVSLLRTIKVGVSKTFRGRVGAILALSGLRELRERLDPDTYGGSPLLGINGVVVIAHGSSTPKAISNAALAAAFAVEQGVVEEIKGKVV